MSDEAGPGTRADCASTKPRDLLLARLHVDEGASLAEVVRDATEIAAGALEVDRVGVWFFADQRRALRCAALFERNTGQHSSGATLRVADFPNYFRALEQHRDISATAARVDPTTHELGSRLSRTARHPLDARCADLPRAAKWSA